MNILDIVILIILTASLLWGLKRGFLASFLQLAGILLVIIIIKYFGERISQLIMSYLPSLPIVFNALITYLLVFFIVMLAAAIVAFIIRKFLNLIMLGWIDVVLGGVMGVLFGLFFIILLVSIMNYFHLSDNFKKYTVDSKLYQYTEQFSNALTFDKLLNKMPGNFKE